MIFIQLLMRKNQLRSPVWREGGVGALTPALDPPGPSNCYKILHFYELTSHEREHYLFE